MIKIHQSYQARLKPTVRSLVLLIFILLISCLFPPLQIVRDIVGYPPFYVLLETISVIVSMMVFAVCWGVQAKDRPGNFLVLATIFLGVGLIDLLHTISYESVHMFATPFHPEIAIQFGLAARGLTAIGLLVVAVLPWQALRNNKTRWIILSLILMIVAIVAWVVLLHSGWIPSSFIEDRGLTNFKISSEYFLIVLYLLCAFLFFRQMNKPRLYDVVGLLAASSIMAMSEFLLTLYVDVNDVFYGLGHIYKVIAYFYIYQSIFMDSIKLPYKQLNESNKKLEQLNKKLEQEILDRNKIEEQLADSEGLLSSILHTLPVAVFAKDIKKGFEYRLWNKFAEKLYGLKAEDLIGKFDYDFFSKEDADGFRARDIEACKGGQEIIEIPEMIVQTKNGSVILHTRKTIVRDTSGEPLFLVGVSEDISEIKRVTDNLRNALNARDEFLIIASHELKTPITSLKLRLQIMQRHFSVDEKMTNEIGVVVNQVNQLTKLINSILDVARIQSGKLILELAHVNLAEAVTEMLKQFAEQLANSNCQVEVKISPEITGLWDEDRIELVLTNLLSNSIKYAPGSKISILATRDEKKTTLIIKDSGPGIPKEKQALLFNRFERAGAPISASGLGLGLFICKKIVEALGGTIRVESQESLGASFIIELPNSSGSLA